MNVFQSARCRARTLLNDNAGLSSVEYVILFIFITVVALGLWSLFGTRLTDAVVDATEEMPDGESARAGSGGAASMSGMSSSMGSSMRSSMMSPPSQMRVATSTRNNDDPARTGSTSKIAPRMINSSVMRGSGSISKMRGHVRFDESGNIVEDEETSFGPFMIAFVAIGLILAGGITAYKRGKGKG